MKFGYNVKVSDHVENPRNVGTMAAGDDIGSAMAGNPASGIVKISIRVEGDVIVDARFLAHGCGHMIACASLATTLLIGRKVGEIQLGRDIELEQALEIAPIKQYCALVVHDAIAAAAKNYMSRPGALPLHI